MWRTNVEIGQTLKETRQSKSNEQHNGHEIEPCEAA